MAEFSSNQPGTASEHKEKMRKELSGLLEVEVENSAFEDILDYASRWNEQLNTCYGSQSLEILKRFLETEMFNEECWILPGKMYMITSFHLKAFAEKNKDVNLAVCDLEDLPGKELKEHAELRGMIPVLYEGLRKTPWMYSEHIIRGANVVSDDEAYLMLTIRKYNDSNEAYEDNDALHHIKRVKGAGFKVQRFFMFDNLEQNLPGAFKKITDKLTVEKVTSGNTGMSENSDKMFEKALKN